MEGSIQQVLKFGLICRNVRQKYSVFLYLNQIIFRLALFVPYLPMEEASYILEW